MFVFRKIWRALFSWNTHFEIRLLAYYRRVKVYADTTLVRQTWNKFVLLNRTGYLQDYSLLTITNTIKITFYEKLITETRFIVLKKIEIWRRLCYFFRTHLEHVRVIFFPSVKMIGFREDYKNDNAKSNTFFKGTKILTLIIHNPGRYASKHSKAFHTSCFSIKLSFFNFFYFATNILSNIISSFIHLL